LKLLVHTTRIPEAAPGPAITALLCRGFPLMLSVCRALGASQSKTTLAGL
jgi:hypothetical protein